MGEDNKMEKRGRERTTEKRNAAEYEQRGKEEKDNETNRNSRRKT